MPSINMNWPDGLKEEVRDLVGPRGVTAFVVTAVRKELDLRAEQGARQPAPVPPGGPNTPEQAITADSATGLMVTDPPLSPIQDKPHQGEAGPDYRGDKVAVAPPTLGTAARFSSSSTALEELKAKAAALGVRSASELPRPAVLRDDDPPRAEDVAVVERVEPVQGAKLPQNSDPDPGPGPAPQPVPAYAARNLDEIDVDF